MKLQQCRIVLRPRNPLDSMDMAVILCRDQAKPLFRLMLWTVVPVWMVMAVMSWLTNGHWLVALCAFCAVPFVQVPFTVLGGRLLFADAPPVKSVFSDLWKCRGGLTYSLFLGGVCWLVVSLVCFVALPFVQAGFLFLNECVLLERGGNAQAARRSFHMSSLHYEIGLVGAVARFVLLVWFVLMGEAGGQFLFRDLLQMGAAFGSLADGQITPYVLWGILFSQPLFAIYKLMLYVDVRTRIEGWDLQVSLRALGLQGREA